MLALATLRSIESSNLQYAPNKYLHGFLASRFALAELEFFTYPTHRPTKLQCIASREDQIWKSGEIDLNATLGVEHSKY
jgi:hypothetical protein